MNLEENLDRVVSRYRELGDLMTHHDDPGSQDYTRMAKEYADLAPVVEAIESLHGARHELEDLEALRHDPDSDSEMRKMAEEEFYALKERLPEIEREVMLLLLPKDEADSRNAILEVRAGTGGDERAGGPGPWAAQLPRAAITLARAQRHRRDAARTGWRGLLQCRGGGGPAR